MKRKAKFRYAPSPGHKNHQVLIRTTSGRNQRVKLGDVFEVEIDFAVLDRAMADPFGVSASTIEGHLARIVAGVPGEVDAHDKRQPCMVLLSERSEGAPESSDKPEPPAKSAPKAEHVAFAKSLDLEVDGMGKDDVIATYTEALAAE